MKILIVEDHDGMRRVLKTIISNAINKPFEIIECETAEDGIKQYKLVSPDYVLMDFELPNLNGLEAAKRIFEFDLQAKIIFVSSIESVLLLQKIEALPIIALISKYNLLELGDLLKTLTN